uniref:Uncharacterized protein n=1 Tax=Octopus bimaculoides TaxID=37653 RepID=A0A0L8HQ89_OCTBM
MLFSLTFATHSLFTHGAVVKISRVSKAHNCVPTCFPNFKTDYFLQSCCFTSLCMFLHSITIFPLCCTLFEVYTVYMHTDTNIHIYNLNPFNNNTSASSNLFYW